MRCHAPGRVGRHAPDALDCLGYVLPVRPRRDCNAESLEAITRQRRNARACSDGIVPPSRVPFTQRHTAAVINLGVEHARPSK
ncbi:hypothetical protein SAMN05216551_109219 [Chitinasiproducens palmae]|uniref:Uncharacterized protein n=1 Tax=Chitinasiproducens palmae TaxID=1770053 RepID=A0A1H2PSD8_9BURK|nr:hypothetical protein SAMN05216551_109219 [Chitinasiproducens palmae]